MPLHLWHKHFSFFSLKHNLLFAPNWELLGMLLTANKVIVLRHRVKAMLIVIPTDIISLYCNYYATRYRQQFLQDAVFYPVSTLPFNTKVDSMATTTFYILLKLFGLSNRLVVITILPVTCVHVWDNFSSHIFTKLRDHLRTGLMWSWSLANHFWLMSQSLQFFFAGVRIRGAEYVFKWLDNVLFAGSPIAKLAWGFLLVLTAN